MQFFLRSIFVACLFFYSTFLSGVTSENLLENIFWLTNLDEANQKIVAQVKGLVERSNHCKIGKNIDLRSKNKKKIRTYLSRLRGKLEDRSLNYNFIFGAWSLIEHYSRVDQKWLLKGKTHFIDHVCPVCHCEAENAIVLLCGHQLCADCLIRWVTSKSFKEVNHRGCPSCRAELGMNLRYAIHLHHQYQELWEKNEQLELAYDHREHMDAQAAFDEHNIHEMFGHELEELILLQEEHDAHNGDLDDMCDEDCDTQEEGTDQEDNNEKSNLDEIDF